MKKILTFRICKEGFEKIIHEGKVQPKYREAKDFWRNRLFEKTGLPKKFDEVHIINGYKKTSPLAIVEFKSISGIEEHEEKDCYKIEFGNILEIQNVRE